MKEWEITFEDLFSKTENTFKESEKLLYWVSIVFGILATLLTGLSLFELQDQGADFFESLMSDENYTNSNYVLIINLILKISFSLLYSTIFVYLFFKITKNEKTLKESFSYYLSKLVPLVLTAFVYAILILPLYLLLFVPGLIFSFFWIFFTHSVLFRDKKYYSALSYSKSLISEKKLGTANCFAAFIFRTWMYWVFSIVILIGVIFSQNNYIYLAGQVITEVVLNILTFYVIIFSIHYFLYLEKAKGISNELGENQNKDTNENSNDLNDEISQTEIKAKNYIEKYKLEHTREEIKNSLMGAQISENDTENYLNKYF